MMLPADVGLNPTCPSTLPLTSRCPQGSLQLLGKNIAAVPPDLYHISPKRALQTNVTQDDVLWIINGSQDKQEFVSSSNNNISSSTYRLSKQQHYLPNYKQEEKTPESRHLGCRVERCRVGVLDICICDPLQGVDYSSHDYVLNHSGEYFQFWERHKGQQDFQTDLKSASYCYNSSELKTNINSKSNSCQESNVSEYQYPLSSDLLELRVALNYTTTNTCDLTPGLVIHSTITLNQQKFLSNLGLLSSTPPISRGRRWPGSGGSACPATPQSCSPAHITSRQPPAGQGPAKIHQLLPPCYCCHKDLQLKPADDTAAKHYFTTMAKEREQIQLANTSIAATAEESNTFHGSQLHDKGLSSQNSQILQKHKSSKPSSILPKGQTNKTTSKYPPLVSPSSDNQLPSRSPSVNSFWLVIILLLCMRLPASQAVINTGNPDAKRLYDDLLSNYNKLVRPVQNTTDPLTVRIKLKLSQLIDVVSQAFIF